MREEFYWEEINGIGKLYTEAELVVGFEPVLFVCSEESDLNNKYLIMTYDSYNGVYIMKKINNQELLAMLENRVTMEETFRGGTHILKTYIDEDKFMQFEEFESTQFDEKLLPRRGEYFELDSKPILKYIEKIKSEETKSICRDEMYNAQSIELCNMLITTFAENINVSLGDIYYPFVVSGKEENKRKKRMTFSTAADFEVSHIRRNLSKNMIYANQLKPDYGKYNGNIFEVERRYVQECVM